MCLLLASLRLPLSLPLLPPHPHAALDKGPRLFRGKRSASPSALCQHPAKTWPCSEGRVQNTYSYLGQVQLLHHPLLAQSLFQLEERLRPCLRGEVHG